MSRRTRRNPWPMATAALLAFGLAPVGAAPGSGRVREVLRNDMPARSDYERMERGYYEQLLDTGRRLDAPAAPPGALAGHAEPVAVEHGRLTDRVDDVREYVLKPGMASDPGRRIPWTTNARGMRDRDYASAKPDGTFRIGLVGDSIAAGWAVEDGLGFEARLERALDAQSHAAGGPAVEILNFAVPGHAPGQRWTHFARVGWEFDPDLVVYQATLADPGWDERRLRVLLARGVGFDAPVYRETLARAGVKPGPDASAYKVLLKPLRWEILSGVYRAVVADCRSRGVPAVWVLIPRVGRPADPVERRRLADLARAEGFAAVIDACDAFEGADPRDLAVAPNDFHPNAEGHARIARAIMPALSLAMAQARSSMADGRPAHTGPGGGVPR